jgi:arylsulfatase A-like enzyme
MKTSRLASVLALFLSVVAAEISAAARGPNVIFILMDDLGWTDLTCYGSSFYETPNLDRLAARGMRFTSAYAACNVCSPTRASIMTGKYPARLGLTDWIPGRADNPQQKLKRPVPADRLPLEEVTLGEAFKQAGYTTAFIGKWHLGPEGFYPQDQGFELSIAANNRGSPPSYFPPYNLPNLSDGPKEEYLTDRLTTEAVKFIEQAKDKPFLLYFSHYAVHNPQQAKPALVEKYTRKLASRPPASGPEFKPEGANQARQIQNRPVYAAMVESMDDSIGRISAQLAALGLEGNTVIVFTSDNGGLSTSEGLPTSNLPLRAGKGWHYEGGVRDPLIVVWPGVTKPGSVNDAPVISTDYYPTLLEIAGLPARPQQHRDGVSFASLLKGGTRPDRALFWHYPHYSNQGGRPGSAVRLGSYKLIEWFEDMRVELFDVKADIGEQRDLAASMPAKAAELRDMLHRWRGEIGARMPEPNPNYDPNAPPPVKKGKAK